VIFSNTNPLGRLESVIRSTWSTSRFHRASLILLALLAIGSAVAACDMGGGSTTNQQQVDQQNNNDAAAKLHAKYPYPQLKDSGELKNETQRYSDLNNDPNRVSYLYLMSLDGKIIEEVQIRGKVSSTDSLYSSPVSIDPKCYDNATNYVAGCPVVPAAQPDGSYGQNEPGIYYFLNDAGHTMQEWNGTYLWSFNEIHLQQPPSIVIIPNGT